ncbi:aminotransferase-like domain-containing protein [Burkholderia pseudomultivorans]|uniref:HTH-type transcriptional regulator NorG n=1 Tax=Burkholderia pseudomultivorans TaxID=1207504 RepID=A0ABU2E9G9_9BURK|nr:PLP-dependent aminotransferase family protein [Burkholderia pseudomultivorans]MDR8729949.1 HTH-type transcriptional regulator NorG [Burkholderia pseudomultivorans]MDR8735791.1 HTH-type transcriptional regulator NorG [Burkholderia pseudomultivorans]MDR8744395.1 HTH-type transcriptional regulator NorG [Burkholderia pseudomultivorans]MDR8756153.1 HTH-type transcriptional regulator NorG [Burkholderia pseudomultivorans]MDR8780946.1 HTH-type transcriptional regulator NorG [Burkholderia pseudomult
MLSLTHDASRSLTQKIVDHFHTLISDGKLQSGMKVPSIRSFAESHGVSVSTVVDAYDRLVAEGCLVPRQNSGFFVRSFQHAAYLSPEAAEHDAKSFDSLWMLNRIWQSHHVEINPGCGWLPSRWLDDEGLRRAMRNMAVHALASIGGYGMPKGYLPLRWKISDWLNQQEVYCPPDQLLMTHGAAHALSLLIQHLIKPGETVFVDSPGYSLLFTHLKRLGVEIVGVPLTPAGPDLAVFARLLEQHRPKAYFTNPRLHNPTGVSCSAAIAHKILQLASRHDFLIVEDDVCADLDTQSRRPFASLDQLERVIYIGSFSKTVSPSLRVGYIAAHPDLVEDLTQLKMATGLTSSEIGERFVYQVLTDGRHRKHLKSLREQLSLAQARARQRLTQSGMILFNDVPEGTFVWARHPGHDDARTLSSLALDKDIYLAPGHLFTHDEKTTPWLRFNVGYCDADALFEFLAKA